MSGILSRYIVRETAQTWLVVTVVLLMVMVTNQFAQVLGDAAANKLPKEAVLQVMGLTSVKLLTTLIPIGLFLSIMLSLGRLYRDSEMAAFMACGIGPAGLYRPLFLLGLLLAALVAWLALVVSPLAVSEVQRIAREATQRADLRVLEPGRFVNFGDGDAVMYAEGVSEDGVLTNVFVQRRVGGRVEVIVADRAWQSDSEQPDVKILRFERGRRYDGTPGNPRFRIAEFDEHGIPYELPERAPPKPEPAARSLQELLQTVDSVNVAELQWRLSVPITVLVLTMLAVPLSRSAPRRGRYSGLAAGVLIYVIYVNLLGAAKVWVEKEEVPQMLGMWWVHAAFLMAGILLLANQHGYLRRVVDHRWKSRPGDR